MTYSSIHLAVLFYLVLAFLQEVDRKVYKAKLVLKVYDHEKIVLDYIHASIDDVES